MRGGGAIGLALAALGLAACSEPAVLLPASWNTLKHRAIAVDVFALEPAPNDVVKMLSGLDGAPKGLADDATDVTLAWWDRPAGSDERDGAHVDTVRVSPGDACALTLAGMFPDPTDAARDALATWEAQVALAQGVRPERVVWQATFAPGLAACPRAAAAPEAWGAAVVRALTRRPVDIVEVLGPEALAEPAGLEAWAAIARAVRAHDAAIVIAGGGFALTDARAAATDLAIDAFLAAVHDDLLPLDVLTFAAHGATPDSIHAIASALRARLDAFGLTTVGLAPIAFGPLPPTTLGEPALVSAQVGAFEMATRIALQDVSGLTWAVSDRGAPPSVYFDAAGRPTPAFMARFPLRQIDGQARVHVDAPADVAALASVDGRTVHVLVVAWDVSAGVGSLDYEVSLPALVPPVTDHVDFRLSELDAQNDSLGSFFFSDLGTLRPDPATGDVRVARTLPVPGVHYFEIERPEFH